MTLRDALAAALRDTGPDSPYLDGGEHDRQWADAILSDPTFREALDRLTDDPEWDATDGAHPAWWRGCDHGVSAERARIRAAVEGLPGDEPGWEGSEPVVYRAAVLAAIDGEREPPLEGIEQFQDEDR